jgi:hypothetical protein
VRVLSELGRHQQIDSYILAALDAVRFLKSDRSLLFQVEVLIQVEVLKSYYKSIRLPVIVYRGRGGSRCGLTRGLTSDHSGLLRGIL